MPSEIHRNVSLIQLGVGHVGAAVAKEVLRLASIWREQAGVSIRYHALADSSGFALSREDESAPISALEHRAQGKPLASLPEWRPIADWHAVLGQAITTTGDAERVIVVDCAVGHGTTELLLAARQAGSHLVLCNKDPLNGPIEQFQALRGDFRRGSLRPSATVGAGLPITSAVAAATASGDAIESLSAVASGSLGYLTAAMTKGASFTDALTEAIAAGYCEPDPRVDLSGHDVARKLLILARLAGHPAHMVDVAAESLIPAGAEEMSRDDFLAALPGWRDHLRDRFATAHATGCVLRYIGTMDGAGMLRASLTTLSRDDPLARGQGPENVFVLHSERYQRHPLVITGPGAGVAVTAGAVVGDILRAAGAL